MGYTWCQFTAYLRLARRRAALDAVQTIVHTNQAMNGGKAANKLVRQLLDQADRT